MRPSPRRRAALAGGAAAIALLLVLAGGSAYAHEDRPATIAGEAPADSGWVWPVRRFRVMRPYLAPAHAYGPGHRGIDLEPFDSAEVRAPAAGIVAFAGRVAGRGVLTIDHDGGLVTTLEPVETSLSPGDPVERAEVVATVAAGGHTAPGALHFGVRMDGDYINPLQLLGGVPRAVLLPCCESR